MDKVNFRILVVLSLLVPLLGAGYDLIFTNALVENVNNYIFEIEQYESMSIIEIIVSSVGFIFLVASIYSLLTFKPWAKHIYILSFMSLIPLYFISGLYVSSGIGQLAYDLSMILNGVILALIYFSPVKEFFTKSGT